MVEDCDPCINAEVTMMLLPSMIKEVDEVGEGDKYVVGIELLVSTTIEDVDCAKTSVGDDSIDDVDTIGGGDGCKALTEESEDGVIMIEIGIVVVDVGDTTFVRFSKCKILFYTYKNCLNKIKSLLTGCSKKRLL